MQEARDPYFRFEDGLERWARSFTALGIRFRTARVTLTREGEGVAVDAERLFDRDARGRHAERGHGARGDGAERAGQMRVVDALTGVADDAGELAFRIVAERLA